MSYSQLINESEIDQILIGNPQITYFKSVYRRHTPFYKGLYIFQKNEYSNSQLQGGFTKTEQISYGGYDLITDIFIEHKINNLSSGDKIYSNIGNSLINSIILKVGQTNLFTTYGLYMEARSELDNEYTPSILSNYSVPPYMLNNINSSLTCNTGNMYNMATFAGGVSGSDVSGPSTDIFYTYPNFYFTKEYGNSFPICALNNTNTQLNIKYNSITEYTNSTTCSLDSTVCIEYVILSYDEKMRFVSNTDIYFYYDIEDITIHNPIDLNSNLPIRQLFFMGNKGINSSYTFTRSTPTSLSEILSNLTIKINADNIYDSQLNLIPILTKQNINRMYKGYGRELTVGTTSSSKGYLDSIGVHSFSLDTTNTPSGHLSSNIDCRIELNVNSGERISDLKLYAEKIKFFRIIGGQLQLLYM